MTVIATPSGIPTTTPTARPTGELPSAQPRSAPTSIDAPVKPRRTDPAPARLNVGRWGSTAWSIPKIVTPDFPQRSDETPTLVTVAGRRSARVARAERAYAGGFSRNGT